MGITTLWIRRAILPTAVAAAALLSSCGYYDYYYDEEQDLTLQRERMQMQQRMQATSSENEQSARDIAALRAELQAFQETQRQLYGVIDELRAENQKRTQDIEKLRSLVSSLESRMATSDTKWQQEMGQFKQRLGTDQQKAMNKLTTNLAEEMERNLQQMRRAAEAQRRAQPAASYGEYTVQSGDTLSAIAQAFGVSIADLKKANGLSSDVIRVGQTLKVPSN